MPTLQTTRRRTDHTCEASHTLKRPGTLEVLNLRCGLTKHGDGLHCDTGLRQWWLDLHHGSPPILLLTPPTDLEDAP